ncbi:mannose-6-phosphate isomerase [Marinilabiliaceae bacterium ANBcel2]|nr:mannose-6-phosphate isomerase [Marinilabiliaceae bacterium ANBcel2]
MTTKLYPLKFKPFLKSRLWGGTKLGSVLGKSLNGESNIGESWELSGVEDNISIIANGFLKGNSLTELIEIYMGDLVGEKIFQKFGEEFPLLIKFIDAREDLSIQVHPDDDLALKRHNSFGKTEMWYVMEAEKDAGLISGFSTDINKQEYLELVESGNLESVLAKHPVDSGDIFFIPAGRVHAIGSGILLAEIQQTSDVTYRIFDFNRRDADGNSRELHTDLAVDAIDYNKYDNYRTEYRREKNVPVTAVTSPYFETTIIDIDKCFSRDYYKLDSFVVLICVLGAGSIEYGEGKVEEFSIGETLLIPADLRQITINPGAGHCKLLEVYIP